MTRSLISRLVQLDHFHPPSLNEMNPKQWNEFLGKKLVNNLENVLVLIIYRY